MLSVIFLSIVVYTAKERLFDLLYIVFYYETSATSRIFDTHDIIDDGVVRSLGAEATGSFRGATASEISHRYHGLWLNAIPRVDDESSVLLPFP